jgi:hypothetical protein
MKRTRPRGGRPTEAAVCARGKNAGRRRAAALWGVARGVEALGWIKSDIDWQHEISSFLLGIEWLDTFRFASSRTLQRACQLSAH